MATLGNDATVAGKTVEDAPPASSIGYYARKDGVRDLSAGDEGIQNLFTNSQWRSAVWIDGQLEWTDTPGCSITDSGTRTYRIIDYGNYVLMAPKEESAQNEANNPAETDLETIRSSDTLYVSHQSANTAFS